MIQQLLIKTVLTVLLVAWAISPYFDDASNESILRELSRIGILRSILVGVGFFVMVGFYCVSLQKCLQLIQPENRKVHPRSVWYMFAIPFNFVEDFFIVIHLAHSLDTERKHNPKLATMRDTGLYTGIGWSLAQVLSFIPSMVGQLAGLIGMILMVYHWITIVRINRLLQKQEA